MTPRLPLDDWPRSPDEPGSGFGDEPGRARKTTADPASFGEFIERPRLLDWIAGLYVAAGVWAAVTGLGAASLSCCLWIPWVVGVVAGVAGVLKGIRMFSNELEPPSPLIAWGYILTILYGDFISPVVGAVILILLRDREVYRYYRAKGMLL